mgnify:CR=1 FL=1
MRVVILGSGVVGVTSAWYLSQAGHEVTVFAPLAEPSTDPGVVALPVSGVFRPDGFPFAWPPAGVEDALRAEFASRRVEVVHVHSEMFAALGGFGAARTLGLPVVQTMHGRIDVYTRNVLPAPALRAPEATVRVARSTAVPASASLTDMPVPLRVSTTCSVAV